MTDQPQLHSSIVAMVSLAAGIASNHPAMGQCQLQRLRDMKVPEHQLDAVIEIARHIRDEAAQKLDAAFDDKAAQVTPTFSIAAAPTESCGCSTTTSGQSCC
ncbi:MAG: hypothetical protein CVV05_14025 [Gammaproteobacteria bacterium HGW-Gammaproteobacteria-1]|jgi:hypothetical protein|nr:MAG: hypothetical protein CVV05_14025 [Gammaproteobacteria bacterium HGW-Gammaproteobacteria-1]